MPAAYAHYRFGEECIEHMPEKMKALCLEHREIFDFGVHGPDIFFYNEPLKKNDVNRWGAEMHHHSGREFFEKCKIVYEENTEKAEMIAYILGFLAHFTLDSTCHAYINAMDENSEFSHNYIESQYEAYLMRNDEKEPMKVDRSESLHPSKEIAGVIANFFENISDEDVLKSLKGQQSTMKLLYSPKGGKKKTLRQVIRLAKIGGHFDDLFLDAQEEPGCHEFNEEIARLQGEAVKKYPQMMRNLMQYLLGNAELAEAYDYDFEGER